MMALAALHQETVPLAGDRPTSRPEDTGQGCGIRKARGIIGAQVLTPCSALPPSGMGLDIARLLTAAERRKADRA